MHTANNWCMPTNLSRSTHLWAHYVFQHYGQKMFTNYVWNISHWSMTTSVAVAQNFQITSDKFNINSTLKSFFQKDNTNYCYCVAASCMNAWKALVKWQHTSIVCNQSVTLCQTCSFDRQYRKCIQKFWCRHCSNSDNLEDQAGDGRIKLSWKIDSEDRSWKNLAQENIQ